MTLFRIDFFLFFEVELSIDFNSFRDPIWMNCLCLLLDVWRYIENYSSKKTQQLLISSKLQVGNLTNSLLFTMFYANGSFDENSNCHLEKELKKVENEARNQWKLIVKLMRKMACFSDVFFMIVDDFWGKNRVGILIENGVWKTGEDWERPVVEGGGPPNL